MNRKLARLVLAALLAAPLIGPGSGAIATPVQQEEPEPLEEFVPTEEVPADSAVAFPVDI